MPSPNPATRREYAGNAVATTLSGSMTNVATTFAITAATDWPTGGVGPFFVVVDAGTATEEKVLCASRSVLTVTVAGSGRGVDGTAAVAHSSGAAVYPVFTAVEANELNAHTAASTAVHGAAGAVVGTTDAKTLTNKTLDAANNTFTNIPQAAVPSLGAHTALTSAHGVAGAVVGTTDTQTLTNKTISGTSNTLSNIPQSAITGLVADLAAKAVPADIATHAALVTGVHGAGGNVVGTANIQTLSNKTIDGSSNALSNIPESAVTGLVADLASFVDGGWIDATSNYDDFASLGSGVWAVPAAWYRRIGKVVHVALRLQSTSGFDTTAAKLNLDYSGPGGDTGGWKTASGVRPVLPGGANDTWKCAYSGSLSGIGGTAIFCPTGNSTFRAGAVVLTSAQGDIPTNEYVYITTTYPYAT